MSAPRSRAGSPVVGAVLLVGVTVVLAAGLGATALAAPDALDASAPRPVVLSLAAAPDGTISLVHRRGRPLDVRDLSVRVTVDGVPLRRQPPVPFFAAAGFVSGPTGAFNPSTDPTWSVGERVSFRVAGTNSPAIDAGDRVTVRVTSGETLVADLGTTA